MKTNLKNMIKALEDMGVDTSKYVVNLNNITIEVTDDVNNLVEDKYIANEKIDRRWITAQTFRMLNTNSYNIKERRLEKGWDAYLRNNYPYKYQFSMLLDEFKVQSKLEIQKKHEALQERQKFFDNTVATLTCQYHVDNVASQIEKELLFPLLFQMERAKSVTEMYGLLKAFCNQMHQCDKLTKKCPEWKDAFKGVGAYESLKNMVKYHGVHINGMRDKEALEYLSKLADEYKNAGWRMHALLKKVIEDNNFDLAQSIEAHK